MRTNFAFTGANEITVDVPVPCPCATGALHVLPSDRHGHAVAARIAGHRRVGRRPDRRAGTSSARRTRRSGRWLCRGRRSARGGWHRVWRRSPASAASTAAPAATGRRIELQFGQRDRRGQLDLEPHPRLLRRGRRPAQERERRRLPLPRCRLPLPSTPAAPPGRPAARLRAPATSTWICGSRSNGGHARRRPASRTDRCSRNCSGRTTRYPQSTRLCSCPSAPSRRRRTVCRQRALSFRAAAS